MHTSLPWRPLRPLLVDGRNPRATAGFRRCLLQVPGIWWLLPQGEGPYGWQREPHDAPFRAVGFAVAIGAGDLSSTVPARL
jgi:hypothetical protein